MSTGDIEKRKPDCLSDRRPCEGRYVTNSKLLRAVVFFFTKKRQKTNRTTIQGTSMFTRILKVTNYRKGIFNKLEKKQQIICCKVWKKKETSLGAHFLRTIAGYRQVRNPCGGSSLRMAAGTMDGVYVHIMHLKFRFSRKIRQIHSWTLRNEAEIEFPSILVTRSLWYYVRLWGYLSGLMHITPLVFW